MANIVQIDYSKMQQVADAFEQQAAEVKRILGTVEEQINVLKAEKWKAEAATKYYNEMDQTVCPAVKKLGDKLDLASEVCKEIGATLKKAEQDAMSVMPREV
ncbi:MAG: WXG100 family type VII secretion target [Chloroflexota bacterium]|nr:WXG100 family type VII secretion target [Chloroflexota bacterium]